MLGNPMSLATTGFEGQMIDLPASVCTCEAEFEAEYSSTCHVSEFESNCLPHISEACGAMDVHESGQANGVGCSDFDWMPLYARDR